MQSADRGAVHCRILDDLINHDDQLLRLMGLNNGIRTYLRRFTISYIWWTRGPVCALWVPLRTHVGKKAENLKFWNAVRGRSSQHLKADVSDCVREDIGKFVRSQQRVEGLLVGRRRISIKLQHAWAPISFCHTEPEFIQVHRLQYITLR